MDNHRSTPLWTLTAVALVWACTPQTVPLSQKAPASSPPTVVASNLPSSSGISCAAGDVAQVLGRTFCVVEQPLSWAAAAEQCQGLGGRLAELPSPVDEAAVGAAVASPVSTTTLWLDLRRDSDGWAWGPQHAQLSTSRWLAGEPNNAGGHENCGEWSTSAGRYNDVRCDARRAVLCEMAADTTCSAEGVETGEGTYCMYSQARLTHAEGTLLCKRTGARLARLESDREHDALRAALGSLAGAPRLWVGLREGDAEGSWSWSSQQGNVFGWLPGEPNDAGGEDCAEWRPGEGGFNDMPCGHALPALCEL